MARLLAAVIILFPLSFVRVDQRGAALLPLVIQLEKTSPAFAAFEDLQNDYLEETTPFQSPREIVQLKSGETYQPEVSSSPTITLALKTLKIKKQPDLLATAPSWKDSENLPPLRKRKEILLSSLSREALRQPTAAERAQELVQQELQRREENVNENVREILTSTGGTIIVRKDSPGEGASPYMAYNDHQKNHQKTEPLSVREEGNFLVKGDVLLNGVPINANWRIYRRVNGRRAETGSMNIAQAQFSIHVSEKKGFIVAELSNHMGQTIGRGEVSLENQDLALHINPVEATTVAAYVPSFVSPSGGNAVAATYKPFGNSLLETHSESLDVSQYTDDSRFFIEAATKDHYPTVAIGFLSALKQIPLYTYKVIKAFRSIVKEFYKPIDLANMALAWGKVLKDGHPVQGAKVEIAGSEGQVIYFNEIGIPRKELSDTTSSGQFAIANLPEGVQSVRVLYGGKVYPAQVFPSFSGKLTHLNLEVPSQFINQVFKIFSLERSDEPVPTSLRIVGSENIYDISQQTLIPVPELNSGLMIETDSGPGYELVRTHLPQLVEKTEIALPAIPVEWINQMLQETNKVLDRRLGWAIGFVGESEAEVRLRNSQDGLYQIIYFDQNLKVQEGGFVPAGGGYLAFNLPLGYQTLEVRPLHSLQSHVESFVSEPHFLHLVGSQRFIKPLGQENL